MLRRKNGEAITIILICCLIIWGCWQYICKPIYPSFTNKTKSTKTFFVNKEQESEAQKKIDSCRSLLQDKNYDNAMVACKEALKKTRIGTKASIIHQLQGKIYQGKKKYDEARKEFLIASSLTGDEQQKLQNEKLFTVADNLFKNEFLKKDYNQRKLLVPVEKAEETLPAHHIAAFRLENMPEVSMPVGHPTPNQLYIAHPYVDKKYIPFDDYEMDFLGERVREFCEFAQALGATEVVIESIQTKSKEESKHAKDNKGGKAEVQLAAASPIPIPVGGNFDKTNENTQYLLNTALRGISISQKFTPTQKPFLPQNLVWYDHEPSWQQLYRQRMRGGLEEHREKIESKRSRVVQNTEIFKIKGELKAILNAAGMNWDENSDHKLDTKDDTEMTILVKFAPLESLGQDEHPKEIPALNEPA